jgi:hypothetical protein
VLGKAGFEFFHRHAVGGRSFRSRRITALNIEFPAEGCPSLNELVRAIARLGGFIDRPKNHPGTQTLWIGLQRSYDLSNAWDTFGPGSKKFLPNGFV